MGNACVTPSINTRHNQENVDVFGVKAFDLTLNRYISSNVCACITLKFIEFGRRYCTD